MGGVDGRVREETVDRCVNRKEVGKRKGGVTCIDMLLDMKREDEYRFEVMRRWYERKLERL